MMIWCSRDKTTKATCCNDCDCDISAPESGELLDSGDIELRGIIADFIMERFNSVPKSGHFWFDIHDSADLLEDINEHLNK